MNIALNVEQAVLQAYDDVSSGAASYAIFRYDGESIVVGAVGALDYRWSDLMAEFSDNDICWALVNVKYRTVDGGHRCKLALVMWVPDLRRDSVRETVMLKQCGVYGQQTLKKSMGMASCTIQANDAEDVTYASMLEKASRFERDAIDKSWDAPFLTE